MQHGKRMSGEEARGESEGRSNDADRDLRERTPPH